MEKWTGPQSLSNFCQALKQICCRIEKLLCAPEAENMRLRSRQQIEATKQTNSENAHMQTANRLLPRPLNFVRGEEYPQRSSPLHHQLMLQVVLITRTWACQLMCRRINNFPSPSFETWPAAHRLTGTRNFGGRWSEEIWGQRTLSSFATKEAEVRGWARNSEIHGLTHAASSFLTAHTSAGVFKVIKKSAHHKPRPPGKRPNKRRPRREGQSARLSARQILRTASTGDKLTKGAWLGL